MLPKEIKKEAVEIWFQDEARVGQQGTITRMWAPKGTRPRAIRQGGHTSAYFFAAACPADDKAVAIIMPEANSEAMQLHLDAISQAVAPGKHAVIICDRATWHTTKKLRTPLNISLLFLPPYSPELNSAEKLWDYMRQHTLANRAFDDYEDIITACCEAWDELMSQETLIQSMCSRTWAQC